MYVKTVFNDEKNARLTLWQRVQMDILAEVSPLVEASHAAQAEKDRQRREEASRRAKSVAFTNLQKTKSKASNGRSPMPLKSKQSVNLISDSGSGGPSQTRLADMKNWGSFRKGKADEKALNELLAKDSQEASKKEKNRKP